MENVEIAAAFNRIADLLELKGANPFRVRAYRTAARAVENCPESFQKLVGEGSDLTKFSGIGKDLASKITELAQTGSLAFLEGLQQEIPSGLLEMIRLRGFGPKKARKVWQELDITTIQALELAAREGRLAQLAGFGKRTEEKILQAVSDFRLLGDRTLHSAAEQMVDALLTHMGRVEGIQQMEVAGSYRRQRETVGDLDLLVVADEPQRIMEHFTCWDRIHTVDSSGDTRGSVILKSGLQVDLRIVPARSFGAALNYFTGSKEHNIHLRRLAMDRGMRLSEYGLFQVGDSAAESEGEWVAGRKEEEVYATLELPLIPPELREDRGEIEAAQKARLPNLIELADIRGDLQMHSTWSDGKQTVEQMLLACAALGYDYFAITDHSKSLAMVGGLNAERLQQQWAEMDEVVARYDNIRLLRGIEVDIYQDGRLDLEDEWLEKLDLVIAAVHSYFDLPAAKQTERLIRALSHPQVNVLAHPTCRIINQRLPIQYDLDAVLQSAVENNVAVELNAQPDRLDLKDTHLMRARELGAMIIINTDAHTADTLGYMRHGVAQARRAWLQKDQVINTLPLEELLAALR